MEKLNSAENTIIVRLLAQADAVFRPWRNPSAAGWGALWRLRRDYTGEGLPWHSEGSDANERQAAGRLLAGLVMGRWVKTFGPRGKVESVRLSTKGEAAARRLCGLPARAAGLKMLDEIAGLHSELGGMGDRGGDGDWIPETLLCRCEWGGDGFGDRAWMVELFALPLLVGGLVESNCTGAGHCYYRMTPAGADLVKARATKVKARQARRAWRCAEPAPDYLRDRTRHKETLETTPTGSRDIGEIPLPVSGWSEEFWTRYKAKMQALAATPAPVGKAG